MSGELPVPGRWRVGELVQNLPAGLLVLDAERRLALLNPRAADVLGRHAHELLGKSVSEVLPGISDRLCGDDPTGRDEDRLRTRYERPDGDVVTLGLRCARLGAASQETLVLFQDITSVESLRRERDRLLQLAAVGEVLPAILHELKNPLAAVTTAVEVLLEEVPEGHVQTELHAILTEVRRLKLSLEGIGLINHGLRTERHHPVDYALLEAFRVLDAQLRTKGIVGRCEIPALPLLQFDPAVMRAVLFNLVTNSMYASSRGQAIDVEARLTLPGPLFVLRVCDQGTGMTPEVLRRCRELFFTTKPNGSGIGLALCDSVVTRAGGELRIASEPGRGTAVQVVLPLSVPHETEHAGIAGAAVPSS